MLIIKIKDCKIPVEGGAISSFGWPLFYFKYCVSSLWLLLFYVIVFRVIFLLFVFGGRLFMNRKTCRFHIYLLPPFRCFLQKLKYVTIKLNLNFKLLSLNVRGIRSIEKWKAIFSALDMLQNTLNLWRFFLIFREYCTYWYYNIICCLMFCKYWQLKRDAWWILKRSLKSANVDR